jgi:hypothetical protein
LGETLERRTKSTYNTILDRQSYEHSGKFNQSEILIFFKFNKLIKTKMKQLNFKTENLVVDWISFKFQSLDSPTKISFQNGI